MLFYNTKNLESSDDMKRVRRTSTQRRTSPNLRGKNKKQKSKLRAQHVAFLLHKKIQKRP